MTAWLCRLSLGGTKGEGPSQGLVLRAVKGSRAAKTSPPDLGADIQGVYDALSAGRSGALIVSPVLAALSWKHNS